MCEITFPIVIAPMGGCVFGVLRLFICVVENNSSGMKLAGSLPSRTTFSNRIISLCHVFFLLLCCVHTYVGTAQATNVGS